MGKTGLGRGDKLLMNLVIALHVDSLCCGITINAAFKWGRNNQTNEFPRSP